MGEIRLELTAVYRLKGFQSQIDEPKGEDSTSDMIRVQRIKTHVCCKKKKKKVNISDGLHKRSREWN